MGNYAKSAALVIIGGIAMYFQLNTGGKKSSKTQREDPVAEPSLVKLAFMFRHGERSPLNSRINDPYPIDDLKFWPEGVGALTKVGKKNAYLLGKRLRKRYDAILTPHYSKKDFVALSTKVDRTLMSAYLVLAGLYPPANHQKWSEELDWMPIPVFHNTVFNKTNCFSCPRFRYEVIKLAKSVNADLFAPLAKFLEEKANLKLKRPQRSPIMWELFTLCDSLGLQKRQGYKVEEWADEFLDLSSSLMHEMFLIFTTKTDVQRQLSSSLVADYLLQFMDDSSKVSMFSAHDLTLYMLAAALGYDLQHPPHPTACIMVEFHDVNEEKLVKAFYIKETNGEMLPIEMSCGKTCSLASFKEMLLRTKPADYDDLCNTLPDNSYADPFLESIISRFSPE
uniref:Lysosomal acid phosphatase n=2 Tax=Lygus hesperus TaxID=30085 RepID=A0A0A9ZAZ1_LYGHE